MSLTQRALLEALSRDELHQVAQALDVTVADRRRKQGYVEALANARRISKHNLLAALPAASLRQLCQTFDKMPKGRAKTDYVAALAPSGTITPAQAAPPKAAAKAAPKKTAPTQATPAKVAATKAAPKTKTKSKAAAETPAAASKKPAASAASTSSPAPSKTAKADKPAAAPKAAAKAPSKSAAKKPAAAAKSAPGADAAAKPAAAAAPPEAKKVAPSKKAAKAAPPAAVAAPAEAKPQDKAAPKAAEKPAPKAALKAAAPAAAEAPAPAKSKASKAAAPAPSKGTKSRKGSASRDKRSRAASEAKADRGTPPRPATIAPLIGVPRTKPAAQKPVEPIKLKDAAEPAEQHEPAEAPAAPAAVQAQPPAAVRRGLVSWEDAVSAAQKRGQSAESMLGQPAKDEVHDLHQRCPKCKKRVEMQTCQSQLCQNRFVAAPGRRICAECMFERHNLSITDFNARLAEARQCPHCDKPLPERAAG